MNDDNLLVELLEEQTDPARSPSEIFSIWPDILYKRVVLLGEASHGTRDYYQWRAEITKELIERNNVKFIAVEGDWPACYKVNRYIKGKSDASSARGALTGFERWPTWMWANETMVELVEWLKEHNQGASEEDQIGFYGLDVYSLWESLEAVINYLEREEPEAVQPALDALTCFQPYGKDPQAYAKATALVPTTCEDEVLKMLISLREQVQDGIVDKTGFFNAKRNARVVRNAERYYRAMLSGHSSWNVRDTHMMETLLDLLNYHGHVGNGVVWEHNTHIGDARATNMANFGLVNVGQLCRENLGSDCLAVGFGSHRGSVIAAHSWGQPYEVMELPEAQSGSWEDVFHRAGAKDRILKLNEVADMQIAMQRRGHRAVGVVYDPKREAGNYVPSHLPLRYDIFVYLDKTEALEPLDVRAEDDKLPETFPTGV